MREKRTRRSQDALLDVKRGLESDDAGELEVDDALAGRLNGRAGSQSHELAESSCASFVGPDQFLPAQILRGLSMPGCKDRSIAASGQLTDEVGLGFGKWSSVSAENVVEPDLGLGGIGFFPGIPRVNCV